MKYLLNISGIILLLLSISSTTSAQGQQRLSQQRSFASVLAKIKEKKSERDKVLGQTQQPASNGMPVATPAPSQGMKQRKQTPVVRSGSPDPAKLPSSQPMTRTFPKQRHG